MLVQYYRTEKGRQELSDRSLRLNARLRALLLMIETEEASTLVKHQLEKLATPENLGQLLEYGLIYSHANGVIRSQQTAEAGQESQQIIASNESVFLPEVRPVQAHAEQPFKSSDIPVPNDPVDRVVSHELPVQAQPVADDVLLASMQVQVKPEDSAEPAAVVPAASVIAPVVATPPAPARLSFDDVKGLMAASLKKYCGLMATGLIREIEQAKSAAQLRLCQMRWVTMLTESRAGSSNIAEWRAQINDNLSSFDA